MCVKHLTVEITNMGNGTRQMTKLELFCILKEWLTQKWKSMCSKHDFLYSAECKVVITWKWYQHQMPGHSKGQIFFF